MIYRLDLGAEILRCAVALAYWVYEYRNSDFGNDTEIAALDRIMNELTRAVKEFKKSA